MPRIINAFAGPDPLATTLAELGRTMFGDQAGGAIKREQLRALQRENVETEALGAEYENYGTPNYDPRRIAQRAALAGDTDYANRERYLAGATGAGANALSRAMAGAGDAWSSTPSGFDATLGETRRSNDMESSDRRYGVDQGQATERHKFDSTLIPTLQGDSLIPTLTPQSQAPGARPVLSNTDVQGTVAQQGLALPGGMGGLPQTEQNYVGADSNARTPRDYLAPDGANHITYDGVTDAQTHLPLPVGGHLRVIQGSAADTGLAPSAQGALDKGATEFGYFDVMGKRLRDVAGRADPRLFGASGQVLDASRGALTFGANVYAMFGANDANEALAAVTKDIQNEIAQQQAAGKVTLSPDVLSLLFSPDGSELEMLGGMYIYQAAKAIANQEGRGLSNEDVQRFTQYIGSPQSWTMDKNRYLQKLDAIDALAKDLINANRTMRGQGGLGGAPAQANPSGAPAAPAQAGPRPRATNPQTGQILELSPDGQSWLPVR